ARVVGISPVRSVIVNKLFMLPQRPLNGDNVCKFPQRLTHTEKPRLATIFGPQGLCPINRHASSSIYQHKPSHKTAAVHPLHAARVPFRSWYTSRSAVADGPTHSSR